MLFVTLILAFGAIGTSAASVLSRNDFTCPEENGFFGDPKNCMKYYECIRGVPNHHTCMSLNGQQLLYRPSDNQCDWPDRVECEDRPVCDKNDENCEEHHITTPAPTVCDGIACDHGDGFYPEGECAECYCRCVGGISTETCCASGLVFNPATESCDWTWDVNGC